MRGLVWSVGLSQSKTCYADPTDHDFPPHPPARSPFCAADLRWLDPVGGGVPRSSGLRDRVRAGRPLCLALLGKGMAALRTGPLARLRATFSTALRRSVPVARRADSP